MIICYIHDSLMEACWRLEGMGVVDVTLTEDQRLLVEAVRELAQRFAVTGGSVADRGGPGGICGPEPGAAWRAVAGMGLPGLLVPEQAGGSGASVLDAALVVEELARELVPVPLLGTLLAADLAVTAGAEGDLVHLLASGRRAGCVVLDEGLLALAPYGIAWDWSKGAVVLALDPDDAGSGTVVQATVSQQAGQQSQGIDPTRGLARVGPGQRESGQRVGVLSAAGRARWEAVAVGLTCADLVGALRGTLAAAVTYAKVREQFGRPVGSFQAVQQLVAEQHVLVEAARSCAWHAAWAADALAPDAALRAAAVAKAYCSEIARPVAEAAIQVWGGLGMTWECAAHLYLRRALLDRRVLGDEDYHLTTIAGFVLDETTELRMAGMP
jgi:alkylation response protein AidB-like acyl-CoA dehydrogenase